MMSGLIEPDKSLEETISALPDLFARRLAGIEKREQELARAEKAFAEETGKAYGSAKPSDVLRLNVGGNPMTVLRRTICYAEGSMLASKFSGRWDESLEVDKDGNFFIDQPHDIFALLVDYFRACLTATPKGPPVNISAMINHLDDSRKMDFIRMVEYYGCTDVVYPTTIHALNSEEDGSPEIVQHPDRTVKSSTWSTFVIKPGRGNHRMIKSFQIKVGDIERIIIGVMSAWDEEEVFKGIGEEKFTAGLDSSNSSFVIFNGTEKLSKHVEGVQISEGSTIRLDLYYQEGKSTYGGTTTYEHYSWPERVFINGKLVFGLDQIKLMDSELGTAKHCYPAISVKGSFRVCDIDLRY